MLLHYSEGRKLCKKLKVATDKPYYMKHYKDGEFHKDYDRNESSYSLSNFLRDPTGDLPWDEDPTATDIFHLQDGEVCTYYYLIYTHLVLCENGSTNLVLTYHQVCIISLIFRKAPLQSQRLMNYNTYKLVLANIFLSELPN